MIGEKIKQKILPCVCVHKAQDELHGVGNRLHNVSQKGRDNPKGWRCSVCERLK